MFDPVTSTVLDDRFAGVTGGIFRELGFYKLHGFIPYRQGERTEAKEWIQRTPEGIVNTQVWSGRGCEGLTHKTTAGRCTKLLRLILSLRTCMHASASAATRLIW